MGPRAFIVVSCFTVLGHSDGVPGAAEEEDWASHGASIAKPAAWPCRGSCVNITTTAAMRDPQGSPITDCYEPHIYKFGSLWYAYGFTSRNASQLFATTIYSSPDLRVWTFRRYIPTDPKFDGTDPELAVALWNVLHNSVTGQYVGYGGVYGGTMQVYVANDPAGPFVRKQAFAPSGIHGGLGDLLFWSNPAGDAYLVYNARYPEKGSRERFTYIYRLTSDYYDVIPSSHCNTTAVMEGLWLFSHAKQFYLVGSSLSGFGVNDNFYLTAPSPLGPWTHRGLIAPSGTDTFKSQTFQGLEVSGEKGSAFVFIGHRWGGLEPPFPNATSIWLPLSFDQEGAIEALTWYNWWGLDPSGAVVPPPPCNDDNAAIGKLTGGKTCQQVALHFPDACQNYASPYHDVMVKFCPKTCHLCT